MPVKEESKLAMFSIASSTSTGYDLSWQTPKQELTMGWWCVGDQEETSTLILPNYCNPDIPDCYVITGLQTAIELPDGREKGSLGFAGATHKLYLALQLLLQATIA